MTWLCQSYDSGLNPYHIFNVPVSDEVVSGGQKVALDVNVGQVIDDLRRRVGLMRRNVAGLRTCLKQNVCLLVFFLVTEQIIM